jgi:outer membrane receptor for ferrienterochelin and colicins
MKIRTLYIIALIWFGVSPAFSAAILKGFVKSEGEAIEYAVVHIKGTSLGAATKEDGSFEIKRVNHNECTIITTCIGYESDTIRVKLGDETIKSINIHLKKSNKTIGEVTVTGTMKEVSLSESPVAIEIITPRLFEKNPTPSIFESLNMVNGVRPQIQCNVCSTGDIHINGMEGAYTMVMIDGMPIVSALGSVYGLMGIPNSIIQRVEVQKGPASTLYGSEAVGGLVNVITKDPRLAPKMNVDLMATSQQEFNGDLSFRYNLGKRITSIFSANVFHFDNRIDVNHDNFTDITLQKRYAFFNKYSFKHDKGNYSHLAIRYYHENRWGGEMQWNEKFRASDSIYGESIYTDRLEVLGMSPLNFLGDGFKLQYSFNSHIQNSAYGVTPFRADQKITFLQLTKNITYKNNDIIIGTAIRYTWYDDDTIIKRDAQDSSRSVPSITALPGVFVQDEIKLDKSNSLLVGLRYDYNTHHGSILSPRANWKFQINEYNTIRLSLGNGYRVVNIFSEDHAAYNGSRTVEIKNNIKPEQSWNGTLNYSLIKPFGFGFVNIETNAFLTRFSNRIVADYFTDANKVIFDNLNGYGINRGLGLQMNWTFNIPLSFNFGATYMDVYLMKKDDQNIWNKTNQVQTPNFTSNFLISYKLPTNTAFDLSGNVYSPMLLPILPNDYRPEYSPWFALLNFQVTQQLSSIWEIYGGCKNFLNFIPKEDIIMRPFDPFDKNIGVNNPNGYTFDSNYNYAPMQGARLFLGVRMKIK